MNHIIDGLKAERDLLRSKLARIEAAIDDYNRWAENVADLVGSDVAPALFEADGKPDAKQTPMTEFEAQVREILERVPDPLKRNEVYDELVKAGVVVGGKEPLNTVASRLSRMKGVINLKGFGYWPEGRPYARAGYPVAENEPTQSSFDPSFEAADPARLAPDDTATQAGDPS